jgi:hypothetical protein
MSVEVGTETLPTRRSSRRELAWRGAGVTDI